MIKQYSTYQLQQISENFKTELKKSAHGNNTSLSFLKHSLPDNRITDTQSAQIIVIGGSTYKSAEVVIEGEKRYPVNIRSDQVPLFPTAKAFLNFIFDIIDRNTTYIAVNFAYPLEPLSRDGRLDGILQQGSKEHLFEGMVGKAIGQFIEDEYLSKIGKKINVAVANDTVCLLLSGQSKYPLKELAAVVVGTGFNSAIVLEGKTVVNLESGNFDKFPQSEEGKIVDSESAAPGTALFEKEIAGGYLFRHYNALIERKKLEAALINSTKELNDIATGTVNAGGTARQAANDLIYRSASLTAAHVAALLSHFKHDITFTTEGSLFWNGYRYKETVANMSRQLEPSYTASFIGIPDCDILGGAEIVSR